MPLCRVCILVSRMVPTDRGVFLGGGVVNLLRVSYGLYKLGHQITIITGLPYETKSLFQEINLPYAQIIPLSIHGRATSISYGIEYLLKTLAYIARLRGHFDIVHGHSSYPPYALVTALSGQILRCPTIQTIYCPISSYLDNQKFKLILNPFISRKVLQRIDRIVAVSRNVVASLESIGIQLDRISLIPMAVDIENSAISASTNSHWRGKLGIPQDALVALFVGNLSQNKGIDILLNAIGIVKNRLPNLYCIITTELKHTEFTQREQKVEAQVDRLGIRNQIIRVNIVDDMPGLMAAADCIVLPFLSTIGITDYPMAALEAMAIGRPVIASCVGGISELIRDRETGLLVKAGDSQSLAEGLLQLFREPDRGRRWGASGATMVRSQFSINNVAISMKALYEEVRHGSKSQRS